MRSDRVSQDLGNWSTSTGTNSRLNVTQTPRNKNKLAPVITTNQPQRRSISPLRYNNTTTHQQQFSQLNDRLSSSPLRVPLQQAISRCFPRDRSIDKSTSRRTFLNKSSRREEGSFIQVIKKINYQDQTNMKGVKAHAETLKFLKKYFGMDYLIPTEDFISKILNEYGSLWDNQNLEQLLEDFTYKVNEIFGVDGIDPKALIVKTKTDGMLGLIMTIFKQLKEQESTRNSTYTSFSRNPQVMSINKSFQQRLNYNENIQNMKNVVQEFMESMYQCMQTQIYNKFNIEMRRMVLKYREAEKMIKKVNEKITLNADLFDLEEKMRRQKKFYEEKVTELEKNVTKLEGQVAKEKDSSQNLRKQINKLVEENKKLKDSMEKLQSALINKALQIPSSNTSTSTLDPSLSRRSTLPFSDRTQQYNNLQLSSVPQMNEPFQIKIDTHIVQKDLGPPSTYTTTTLGGNNMPSFSPLKENKENSFMEGKYSYSPYGAKFGTTSRIC